jgi:hypothetical protein
MMVATARDEKPERAVGLKVLPPATVVPAGPTAG